MRHRVKREMCLQPFNLFGRAPGLSKQPIDVRPEHRKGVI